MGVPPGSILGPHFIINRACLECQSHKLTVEDPVTVEYITRFIAQLKQIRVLGIVKTGVPPGSILGPHIIINRAHVECQSHKPNVEGPVTVEYITRFIAQLKQVSVLGNIKIYGCSPRFNPRSPR